MNCHNLNILSAPNAYFTSPGIYATEQEIYCPFEINVDPMERLLLINFEKDADQLYLGFEPQVFDDTKNGKGMLVIGWRIDGKIDIYHQPSLTINPQKYDIAGKGAAHIVVKEMPGAYFEVNKNGAQAYFKFTDILGRPILVSIHEEHPKKREPFGLLAPMGNAAENPSSMPLVLLHDFYFVRQKHTEISIKIDGKLHVPDKLPLPIDGAKMFFTRYSSDPFIVTLNPAFKGLLTPLHVGTNEEKISGRSQIDIENSGSITGIKRLSQNYKDHIIQLYFDPAFPNIAALKENFYLKGNFGIQGHPTTGNISGYYEVTKNESTIEIVLKPSGGWIPNEKKLTLKFLYSIAKIFKHWPKTYRWNASIKKDINNQFIMTSSWKRVKG